MPDPPAVPAADIVRVAAAQERFESTIASITDRDARRKTALPGWTVAHVLTHVARNADSHRRRADAAIAGQVVEQYTGGFAGREEEIQHGALRSANELVVDLRVSAAELHRTWAATPEGAWLRPTVDVGGRRRRLNELPGRRWQELEVHLVDLGLGPTHRDWSDDFVECWLPRLRSSLEGRIAPSASVPRVDDARDELAWLYGRLTGPGWPVLAPWG